MIWFLKRKVWGYNDDQMAATTHPIRVHIPNTNAAYSIFDGITYSKGAACIKQLIYLIGEDKFSKCLNEYFQQYAWSNAEFTDFMRLVWKQGCELIPLEEWSKCWF